MIGQSFYFKSIKKVISAFGSLFNEIIIITGNDKEIVVPIKFSQRSKLYEALFENKDLSNMKTGLTLPVIGFEISGLSYNPEQMTNPINLQRHRTIDANSSEVMLTSVPYTINIEMFVMTNTLDESYQISEQILPFFTPSITLTIQDLQLHDTNTNLIFTLNAVSFETDYESDFSDNRVITQNYSFSVNTKFHSNPRKINKIKTAILTMSDTDHEDSFEKLVGTRVKNTKTNEFNWEPK